jgi:hypothetical protein
MYKKTIENRNTLSLVTLFQQPLSEPHSSYLSNSTTHVFVGPSFETELYFVWVIYNLILFKKWHQRGSEQVHRPIIIIFLFPDVVSWCGLSMVVDFEKLEKMDVL